MKKMDEMERMLTLKSIRVSWILVAIFLLGWGIKNYFNGLGQTLPMMLFIAQVLAVIISKYIYMIKADDKDSKGSLIKIVVVTLLIVATGFTFYYFKIS